MGPSSDIKPEIIHTRNYPEYNDASSYQNVVSDTGKEEDITIKSESQGYHQYMNLNPSMKQNNLASPNSKNNSFSQTRLQKTQTMQQSSSIPKNTLC